MGGREGTSESEEKGVGLRLWAGMRAERPRKGVGARRMRW